ncbi:HEAT repeat domain-containing protein [Plantactinospora sp. B5E13]|uniref:HEAT repeat domain-containing protein n=1 Tax=Plantactinospora sp. B5E13 TaxID=3153758 RepID=UPI00325CAF57
MPLTAINDVDWTGLTHAYGPAGDVPDMLRGLAAGEPEQVEQAWDEVVSSLFHQGTVYPATVPAVRFLVALARAGSPRRAAIVALVGMLADPAHTDGDSADQVRAAVRAEADRLRPLLADPDPTVRGHAAYALAQCGDVVPVGVLRDRLDVEESPGARASLLLALGLRDPAGSAELLGHAVTQGPPPARLAAALAMLRAGLAGPSGGTASLAEAFRADGDAHPGYGGQAEAFSPWLSHGSVLDEVVRDASAEVAADLSGRLLAAPAPTVRSAAIWALGERVEKQRSAPERFVPLLAPTLDDPVSEVREAAVWALRRAGRTAGVFADRLARIAARFPMVAGNHGTAEQHALETLALLGDPRWLDPLCAAWAAGREVWFPSTGLWCSPANLAAVRHQLRELAATTGSAADPADAETPTTADAGGAVVRGLAGLLAGWSTTGSGTAGGVPGWRPSAAEAGPELRAVLSLAPRLVSRTLALLRIADAATEPYLRTAALDGDLHCAVELWRLNGDAGPLLTALEPHVTKGGNRLGWELPTAARAAEALGPLVPRLRHRLTGTAADIHPDREVQIATARIVWRNGGDPAEVLPTLVAILDARSPWADTGGGPAQAAVALAADLGAVDDQARKVLLPSLRRLLADGVARVAAARALWLLGEPRTELVPALLDAVREWYADPAGVALLVEMVAVEAVPGLTGLADAEERLRPSTGGSADDTVWADEWFREVLRTAVARLSPA